MKTLKRIVLAACAAAVGAAPAFDWSGRTGVVELTESADVTDADLGVVTNLTGIVLANTDTDLVFVNATVPATLNGTITGAGRIVKRGAAAVWLGKPHTTGKTPNSGWGNGYQDNYTTNGILVETGDLWLPQDGAAAACYGPVTVAADATLHIQPDSMTCLLALNGAGTVSNGRDWTCWDATDHSLACFIGYYGSNAVSDFTGSFVGNFAVTFCGNVTIHGADTCRAAIAASIYRNAWEPDDGGILRVNKFGMRPPSSYRYLGPDTADLSSFASPLGIGTSYFYGADYDINYGGWLVYTGAGEKTDKIFRFGGVYNSRYDRLDVGATGGVEFAGEFRGYSADRFYGVILTGSNATEVTVSGKVGGQGGRMHYVKAGSGTWNWQPSTRTDLNQAFFITDGTLRIPTLADIGVDCALGYATNCWKTKAYDSLPDYWTNAANRLDCEIVLGDWDKNGTNFPTLAYTGASTASSNRRIGLIGVGGTIANTNAAGALKLTGEISPRTRQQVMNATDTAVRAKTLCLDGVGTGNEVGPISDNAAGTVNLVKTGAGTWTVRDDFAICGDIDVREGVLAFAQKGLASYSWYRYTITQLNTKNDAGNAQYVWQKQLGIFDEDGNRLSQDFEFVGPDESVYKSFHVYEGNYDWPSIRPGQVTMGEYKMTYNGYSGLNINGKGQLPSNLFLDSDNYLRGVTCYLCKLGSDFKYPIVFRLPEGSKPVRYFDIVQFYDCSGGNHVGAFTFEGSDNGVDWVMLTNVTECTHTTGSQWFSTGTAVTNGQNCLEGHFGYPVATGRDASEKESLDLSAANSIKVAHGATLRVTTEGVVELPKLTVDCVGDGVATVKGFKIAASGVLNLLHEPEGDFTVPVAFEYCSDVSNIAGWTVHVDGVRRARKLFVQDGTVYVSHTGTVIYIR